MNTEEAQPNKGRILVVDDEEPVGQLLQNWLTNEGYHVRRATGFDQVECFMGQAPFDLVTLDISMPKSSGTRFYKEVKADEALSSIPVIIVTAVTGPGGDPYGYEKFISNRNLVSPPEGFFPKPIDRDEFLNKVKELLAP